MLIPNYALTALELLNNSGYKAYIVGGCIRDAILKAPPNDWDIATSAKPEEVKKVFHQFKVIETGLKHGTLSVLIDGNTLEITTFREDNDYINNRKPKKVTFVTTLEEDISRRDFTINSLAYHPEEGIIDFFGGKKDIDNKVIRAIGNPDERFREDALRMLRAMRFSSVLGFDIEKTTEKSIHKNKALLNNISVERIREEFTKILCGKNVSHILKNYADVIEVFIPEIKGSIHFEQKNDYHIYDVWNHTIKVVENIRPDTILRWSALLHDIGKPNCFTLDDNGVGHFYSHQIESEKKASLILNRLKFDNKSKYAIKKLVLHHQKEIPPTTKSVKRQLNKLGEELFFLLIELFIADAKGQNPKYIGRVKDYEILREIAKDILDQKECFSLKNLAINGNDLLHIGLKGKEIGETLKKLLEEVMNENLENKREILIERSKELTHRV